MIRTIVVRTDGPTPGVKYPGEYVRLKFPGQKPSRVVYMGVRSPTLWQRFLKIVEYICILPEFF